MLCKFAGPLVEVTVPLAKNILALLANIASAFVIEGVTQTKMRVTGALRAGKEITLFIPNENIDEVIRIIKSSAGVLIDEVSEIVKH